MMMTSMMQDIKEERYSQLRLAENSILHPMA